jgi:prepilin-type N-terminal cleavage/methylation domain-containing protein
MFKKNGFTLIEIVVVMGIMAILLTIVFASFNAFDRSQGVDKDVETIVAMVRQAQNQTLGSKNLSQYGVKLATTSVTLFAGATYTSSDPANEVFALHAGNTIQNISLTASSTSIVFQRLTGNTVQEGTFVVRSADGQFSRTVTMYKTGIINVSGL